MSVMAAETETEVLAHEEAGSRVSVKHRCYITFSRKT